MGATPRIPMTHPVEWFRKIEADIRLLREQMGNILAGTGLSVPTTGTTQVDGNLNVVGTATVSGANGIKSSNFVPGTSGWNLTGTQVEIDTGAIGNSALVHPVSFDGAGGSATNFGTSTAQTVTGSTTSTVPAGMTKMASFLTGNVSVVNSTAAADYLYAAVAITANGTTYLGNQLFNLVGAGVGGEVSCSKYGVLTGLTPGATITFDIRVNSQSAAWAANAVNRADLEVLILWGA